MVFYVKYLAHQIYADILKARPDVRLDRLENDSADAGRGTDPRGGACLPDRRGNAMNWRRTFTPAAIC